MPSEDVKIKNFFLLSCPPQVQFIRRCSDFDSPAKTIFRSFYKKAWPSLVHKRGAASWKSRATHFKSRTLYFPSASGPLRCILLRTPHAVIYSLECRSLCWHEEAWSMSQFLSASGSSYWLGSRSHYSTVYLQHMGMCCRKDAERRKNFPRLGKLLRECKRRKMKLAHFLHLLLFYNENWSSSRACPHGLKIFEWGQSIKILKALIT